MLWTKLGPSLTSPGVSSHTNVKLRKVAQEIVDQRNDGPTTLRHPNGAPPERTNFAGPDRSPEVRTAVPPRDG